MAAPGGSGAPHLGRFAWALFNWAHAPFTTLIITFVFPPYFVTAIVGDPVRGQAIWGYALAATALAVALLAAPLGAVADAAGRRKPWILAFTLMCVAGSALLWHARPAASFAGWAIACVVVADLGYEFAIVFSNAMLPDIVAGERLGRLSGRAWALGYCGGLAALAIALLVFIRPATPPFGLDRATAEHVRIVGPLVAAWFAIFGWPLFAFTPDRAARPGSVGAILAAGARQLRALLPELRRRPDIVRFLLANMLYTDGLATLFAFGGIYVAGTFGMTLTEVMTFGVLLNVTAIVGSFAFAWVDDRFGSRRTVLLALIGLIVAGSVAVLAQTRPTLWAASAVLGLFVGPVQAASRSLLARVAPAERRTEFFGLFALSGRATSFIGPALVAVVTGATHSQRWGIAVIVVLWTAGLGLLATVPKGRR
jgi:UMF1 family MFS transporter